MGFFLFSLSFVFFVALAAAVPRCKQKRENSVEKDSQNYTGNLSRNDSHPVNIDMSMMFHSFSSCLEQFDCAHKNGQTHRPLS